MNPRIYKDKAAKQAEYREAKKLGMTCAEYRAHIAAGDKPAPETEGNHGWDMLWAARARKADMEESKTASTVAATRNAPVRKSPNIEPQRSRRRSRRQSPHPSSVTALSRPTSSTPATR